MTSRPRFTVSHFGAALMLLVHASIAAAQPVQMGPAGSSAEGRGLAPAKVFDTAQPEPNTYGTLAKSWLPISARELPAMELHSDFRGR